MGVGKLTRRAHIDDGIKSRVARDKASAIRAQGDFCAMDYLGGLILGRLRTHGIIGPLKMRCQLSARACSSRL